MVTRFRLLSARGGNTLYGACIEETIDSLRLPSGPNERESSISSKRKGMPIPRDGQEGSSTSARVSGKGSTVELQSVLATTLSGGLPFAPSQLQTT